MARAALRRPAACQSPRRDHGCNGRAPPKIFPSHAQNVTHPPNQVCYSLPHHALAHPSPSISYIIPADLVDLISSHALLSPSAPTILDIPPPFTLDSLSAVRDARFYMPPPPYFYAKQTHFRTRSDVTDALQAAINSGMDYGANRFKTEFSPEPHVSVSLSMSIPTVPVFPAPMMDPYRPPNNIHRPPIRDPSLFTIGNLFLSSCPGKKGMQHLTVQFSKLTRSSAPRRPRQRQKWRATRRRHRHAPHERARRRLYRLVNPPSLRAHTSSNTHAHICIAA